MNVDLESIMCAKHNLKGVANHTPLELNQNLSEQYDCNVYLKREDLQKTRSYKLRGAFNFLVGLEDKGQGVVCASAGNHAQGVAFACNHLGVKGTIFMPKTTPKQKQEKTEKFGNGNIEIILEGDTFDDACKAALRFCAEENKAFVHPFNDSKVISGQATVAVEILEELECIDYILVPVGGGGLIAGVSTYTKIISPATKVIGVEPRGAASMYESFKKRGVVRLRTIDKFVDGAAVRRIGHLPFEIARKNVDRMMVVSEGQVCKTMIDLYNNDGIIAEPAGALSITGLDFLRYEIKGKNIACILSGGNNDFARNKEIQERAEAYQNQFILAK